MFFVIWQQTSGTTTRLKNRKFNFGPFLEIAQSVHIYLRFFTAFLVCQCSELGQMIKLGTPEKIMITINQYVNFWKECHECEKIITCDKNSHYRE